jgi:hypothetical protein
LGVKAQILSAAGQVKLVVRVEDRGDRRKDAARNSMSSHRWFLLVVQTNTPS